MNFFVKQTIMINTIKINAIANASVLQIGSAGIIKSKSLMTNSGGFEAPAPEAHHPLFETEEDSPQVQVQNRKG